LEYRNRLDALRLVCSRTELISSKSGPKKKNSERGKSFSGQIKLTAQQRRLGALKEAAALDMTDNAAGLTRISWLACHGLR